MVGGCPTGTSYDRKASMTCVYCILVTDPFWQCQGFVIQHIWPSMTVEKFLTSEPSRTSQTRPSISRQRADLLELAIRSNDIDCRDERFVVMRPVRGDPGLLAISALRSSR